MKKKIFALILVFITALGTFACNFQIKEVSKAGNNLYFGTRRYILKTVNFDFSKISHEDYSRDNYKISKSEEYIYFSFFFDTDLDIPYTYSVRINVNKHYTDEDRLDMIIWSRLQNGTIKTSSADKVKEFLQNIEYSYIIEYTDARQNEDKNNDTISVSLEVCGFKDKALTESAMNDSEMQEFSEFAQDGIIYKNEVIHYSGLRISPIYGAEPQPLELTTALILKINNIIKQMNKILEIK